MQITQITAHAGRKFNHPYEQFSNLSPGITLTAVINDDEDPLACAQHLQSLAESMVETQKQQLIADLAAEYAEKHKLYSDELPY